MYVYICVSVKNDTQKTNRNTHTQSHKNRAAQKHSTPSHHHSFRAKKALHRGGERRGIAHAVILALGAHK